MAALAFLKHPFFFPLMECFRSVVSLSPYVQPPSWLKAYVFAKNLVCNPVCEIFFFSPVVRD